MLVACACNCGGGTQPPPPKDPPQVFLTVENANVVGTQLTMTVTVNGCDTVALLEMEEHDALLKRVPWNGNPTTVTLVSGDFQNQYATLGIAVDLISRAKATCDDTRTNQSLP